MTSHIQICKCCNKESKGEIYHLGFSDMDCMYCDSCPSVLLLKDGNILKDNGIVWPNLQPSDKGWEYYDRHLLPMYAKFESLFKPCNCGGRYRAWAVPRCSICNDYLFGVKPEPDKPTMWPSKYVFVTVGSVNDNEHLV
jgi:hypothetical protein